MQHTDRVNLPKAALFVRTRSFPSFTVYEILFAVYYATVTCQLWFMDDDGIVFEKQIVGKFHIRQHARSDEISLNFVADAQFATGIISDCNRLVYDSISKELFVEERLWDSASSFVLIKINDANAPTSLEAFEKSKISERVFLTKLDTCRNCKVWDTASCSN